MFDERDKPNNFSYEYVQDKHNLATDDLCHSIQTKHRSTTKSKQKNAENNLRNGTS